MHRRDPDDPVEWLNRAKASLVTADHVLPGMYLEDRCFDAQQAAEKALKALLLHVRGDFPRSHQLGGLLELLMSEGVEIPDAIRRVARLTEYAVARYPTTSDAVTDEQYGSAVDLASTVVQWVAEFLSQTRTLDDE